MVGSIIIVNTEIIVYACNLCINCCCGAVIGGTWMNHVPPIT